MNILFSFQRSSIVAMPSTNSVCRATYFSFVHSLVLRSFIRSVFVVFPSCRCAYLVVSYSQSEIRDKKLKITFDYVEINSFFFLLLFFLLLFLRWCFSAGRCFFHKIFFPRSFRFRSFHLVVLIINSCFLSSTSN